MATKKSDTAKTKYLIQREDLEKLIYGHGGARRFTQDSPILPDVWVEFGKNPGAKVDLLLNPHFGASPGTAAKVVEERLNGEQQSDRAQHFLCADESSADIAYNQSTVVVRLCFHELLRVVLPLTAWWNKYIWADNGMSLPAFLADEGIRRVLVRALDGDFAEPSVKGVAPQILWMMRVIGTIAVAAKGKGRSRRKTDSTAIVEACAELLADLPPTEEANKSLVWSVTRNRLATATIWRSTMAVKADASRRLFEISCKNLAWAVIDSGIDATHPAFRSRHPDGTVMDAPALNSAEVLKEGNDWRNLSRVVETYDFTLIRYLLRADPAASSKLPPGQRDRLQKAQQQLKAHPEEAKQLRQSLRRGRNVDWDLLKPLIEIPHNSEYTSPRHHHGTHVAGILAADWQKKDPVSSGDYQISGVCPDLRLYDLRVLDDDGRGDEFSVIAAMQFVRHLNANKDQMVIHGVNLSLSIRHDVANFACGSTPVCEEASRLIGAGIVVVAAAGNNGYLHFTTMSGNLEEGYRSISITDPGNTEGVITVGSTHRDRAHTYGVSYFSSRGPTGDGRIKPDLVAPGEKIVSTVPGGETERMDGTSMAAPHVSGAAALLLARYQELVGRPARIKEILCLTATDLGRERYFQGAGMLDTLRALQSV
jgi:serine protease AprX